VSGTTIHASDTITFTSPLTANTNFFVNLSPADFPNISSFAMASTTGYALRLWGPSAGYGILRTTGYAENTSNDFYTVNDGFVALSTFRNNVPNYGPSPPTNTATLSIAFGTTAVPEPSTLAFALVGIAGGWAVWRRARRAA